MRTLIVENTHQLTRQHQRLVFITLLRNCLPDFSSPREPRTAARAVRGEGLADRAAQQSRPTAHPAHHYAVSISPVPHKTPKDQDDDVDDDTDADDRYRADQDNDTAAADLMQTQLLHTIMWCHSPPSPSQTHPLFRRPHVPRCHHLPLGLVPRLEGLVAVPPRRSVQLHVTLQHISPFTKHYIS